MNLAARVADQGVMTLALLRIMVLYCALVDLGQVADRAGQMQDLHQQLAKAARELSEPDRASGSPFIR
jgi:hypothetical protein